MTRKDYQAVADILREVTLTPDARAALITKFSRMFERDNPRFDWARFAAACVPPKVPK